MISKVTGTVIDIGERYVVLDVQGLGYKVATTPQEISRFAAGATASLHTYLAVRETALELYGFSEVEDLRLFELLITVSGIGPKTALGTLSAAAPQTIRLAISQQNAGLLTMAPGIGKKAAEKIVHELKGSFEGLDASGASLHDDDDTLEALKSLGYSHQQAHDALKKVSDETSGTGARVKEALKILGSRLS